MKRPVRNLQFVMRLIRADAEASESPRRYLTETVQFHLSEARRLLVAGGAARRTIVRELLAAARMTQQLRRSFSL
jgi:hypothetical protein